MLNFTKLQAAHVIDAAAKADLDDACYRLQEIIGQTAGDNAGMFFSHCDGTGPSEDNWPRANQAARHHWLVDYLHAECGEFDDAAKEAEAHKIVSLIGEALTLVHKATGQVAHVQPPAPCNFSDIRTRDGDDYSMPSVLYESITVRAMVDDEEDYPDDAAILQNYNEQFDGDLLDNVPNIEVKLDDGRSFHLTWNEAHNLGKSLQDVARVCLFG